MRTFDADALIAGDGNVRVYRSSTMLAFEPMADGYQFPTIEEFPAINIGELR